MSRASVITEVPVVDLSAVLQHREHITAHPDARTACNQIATACQEWGFFQCTGHGIPEQVTADFDAAMRNFFAAPRGDKLSVKRTATNSRGYFDDELTKQTPDWKECIDIGQPWTSEVDGENQWPTAAGLESFRPAVERYYAACRELSETLLAVCAVGLGLPQRYFDAEMASGRGHTSFLRLNHYPKCPRPAPASWGSDEPPQAVGHLGINKHSDAGCITVLRQYVGEPASLQVLHRGGWRTVIPQPNSFTINIGDMMQVWSNNRYVAPIHRVLASETADRFSAPFFYNPPHEAQICPVPTMGPPRYRSLSWGEFRRRRFEGDVADSGQEVQIADWAVPAASL